MPKIQVLPPETARLIAAGEVIDRPAAALRELLDNAIDAGASEISAELVQGGIASMEVIDDGSGMDADDLALALLPHATSKIRSADDLLRARSLGFRGEALPSIAAAARLEVTSRVESMREARHLVSIPGCPWTIEPKAGRRGTRILVRGLFDNFPARRQFLKKAQAEGAACRQVFVDKALPHPGIAFRLSSEGRLIDLFPIVESLVDRVRAVFEEPERGLLHELSFSGEGFDGKMVVASPSYYRSDRRFMQIFVNRRRVQDFGLLSGLDYGFEGLLPGGAHPAAFLFVEIDPALADFNIHPAKKEVRFRDPSALRHAFTKALQGFLRELVRTRPESALPSLGDPLRENLFPRSAYAASPAKAEGGVREWQGEKSAGGWAGLLRERPFGGGSDPGPENPEDRGSGLRYLGTALDLFLVVEREGALYLIDQHAAHERILFDELSTGRPAIQELLVPILYVAESESEEARLAQLAAPLDEAGFGMERAEGGDWLITAVPAILRGDAMEAVRELLAGGEEDPLRAARAMTACKAAIKEGETLEPEAALSLAERAFALAEPRCPHGRPIWIRLGREEMFRLVRRIV
ncbi:MAG: DNA mismatch repair endonuclease MutL [Spirochaetota bacterium]